MNLCGLSNCVNILSFELFKIYSKNWFFSILSSVTRLFTLKYWSRITMHVTSSPPLENVFDFNIIHLLMTICNDTHSSRLRTVRIMDTWLSWKNSNFKTELFEKGERRFIFLCITMSFDEDKTWWIAFTSQSIGLIWPFCGHPSDCFFSRYPLYRFRNHLEKHCHFLWKELLSRICKWSNRKTEKKLSRENRKRTKMSESNRNEWNPHSFQQLSKWIIDLEAFESQ